MQAASDQTGIDVYRRRAQNIVCHGIAQHHGIAGIYLTFL
jgi:ABC-type uncharacterized transport system permease subunit